MNRLLIAFFASAGIFIAAAFAGSQPAVAAGTSLHVCNQSSTRIIIAVGYYSSGNDDSGDLLTGPFVSVGWWGIDVGNCVYIANPFAARYMFWLGYSPNSGYLWTQGDRYFCIPDTSVNAPVFTMESQNESQSACVNGRPFSSNGPNQWMPAHEVDMDVNPEVVYSGT